MDFIIVAKDDLASLGRQLAHALSLLKTHSGAFWTVKHYKDNEAQIDGKQPIVFIGENEVSKSFVDVLPERFRAYGTICLYEGAKAVLIATTPNSVSREDLADLQRAVDKNREELRRRAAADEAAKPATKATGVGATAVGAATASAIGVAVATALWPVTIFWLPLGIYRVFSARKRKTDYRKLQNEYVLSRFLKDEFGVFLLGVEKVG